MVRVPPMGCGVIPRMLKMELYRKKRGTMINYLSEYSTAIKTEKIFALVIESGFAYCCIWVRSFLLKNKQTKFHTLVLTCVRIQILYLISAFHVFPKPGFAVMDAVLPYVSVRPLPTFLHPICLCLSSLLISFFIGIVTIAGSIPDSRHHLCRLTKIPDVRDNETSPICGGAGLAYTSVDTVQHATGPNPYRFGHDGVS